jgi:hypothetical protein
MAQPTYCTLAVRVTTDLKGKLRREADSLGLRISDVVRFKLTHGDSLVPERVPPTEGARP